MVVWHGPLPRAFLDSLLLSVSQGVFPPVLSVLDNASQTRVRRDAQKATVNDIEDALELDCRCARVFKCTLVIKLEESEGARRGCDAAELG